MKPFANQVANLIALVSMLLLILSACNGEKPITASDAEKLPHELAIIRSDNQDIDTNTDQYSSQISDANDDSSSIPPFFMVLDDATEIFLRSFDNQADTFVMHFAYCINPPIVVTRILKIVAYTSVQIFNAEQDELFKYRFDYIDTNKISYFAATPTDSLLITNELVGTQIQTAYQLNSNIHYIEFADDYELQRAEELFAGANLRGTDEALTEEDQELISRLQALADFMDVPNTLSENMDARVTSALMSDPEFISWLKERYDAPLSGCGKECICGIAAIAARISCPFLASGWGAIVCVPASGVALACALSAVFSAFF